MSSEQSESGPTFADEIERGANGEPILGIVVGASRSGYMWDEDVTDEDVTTHKADVVLAWDEARPVLDYVYDHGYGGADCHPITAWTESRVIFVHEYDGSTSLMYLPRNPVDHKPDHSGLYDYA